MILLLMRVIQVKTHLIILLTFKKSLIKIDPVKTKANELECTNTKKLTGVINITIDNTSGIKIEVWIKIIVQTFK